MLFLTIGRTPFTYLSINQVFTFDDPEQFVHVTGKWTSVSLSSDYGTRGVKKVTSPQELPYLLYSGVDYG